MKLQRAALAALVTWGALGCGLSIVGVCDGCAAFDASGAIETDDAAVSRRTANEGAVPLPLPLDGGAAGDAAPVAPGACESGEGTCRIDCAAQRCPLRVACPPGRACVVRCSEAFPCPSSQCPEGQPCELHCDTQNACADAVMGAGYASMLCYRCGGCDRLACEDAGCPAAELRFGPAGCAPGACTTRFVECDL